MATSTAEDGDGVPEFLTITKHLEQVISEEGSTVIFECIVEGHPEPVNTWFKNGNLLETNQRTGMSASITITKPNTIRTVYNLIIKNICVADEGIYNLVCRNSCTQLTTEAVLFASYKTLPDGVFYHSFNSDAMKVYKHLRNVHVEEGDQIVLEVVFCRDITDECLLWFKNNEIIEEDLRIRISRSYSVATLIVLESEMTDTGVYCVMHRTVEGIVSSFAEVHVIPGNETNDKEHLRTPVILEIPNEAVGNEHDQLTVVCKVEFNIYTSIHWQRNCVPVTTNSNFVVQDYGCQYIGLRLTNVSKTDSGNYKLTLQNEVSGKKDTSNCNVVVKPMGPMECAPPVKLGRPLTSAVACVGSKLVFDCSFALEDTRYFHVVWYVGHYKIERTNSKFSVIYKGGEYLLYIKKLEPDMAGAVTCELRKSLLNQKTVRVGSSTASLHIVPSKIIEKERKHNAHLKNRKIYDKESPRLNQLSSFDETAGNNTSDKEIFDDGYLHISYCRLDENYLFYLYASKGNREVNVSCLESISTDSVEITWDSTLFPRLCWFAIQIGQSDGSYVEAGVSSKSTIVAQKLSLETILKIRVRAVPIPNDASDSLVVIESPQEESLKLLKSDKLRTMGEYKDIYTSTDIWLGFGAFGSVALAMDTKGNHYAVKHLKTPTQKEREKARREYEMMKKINHSKLIQLVEAFHNPTTFVIVMEYLWAGELFERVASEEFIIENDVAQYVRQICEGLSYLHSQNIAHLDVKPENIVCMSPNSCQVKLIDFGLAAVLDGRSQCMTYGTRDYMAPELLDVNTLTVACDMWSVGVVTYVLLSGQVPFGGSTWMKQTMNIISSNYDYSDVAFNDISDLAKNFVDQLLLVDTRTRMTASQALQHKWLKKGPSVGAMKQHMKRTRENMRTYLAAYRNWQKAGRVMIAARRLRISAISSNMHRPQESIAESITESNAKPTTEKIAEPIAESIAK